MLLLGCYYVAIFQTIIGVCDGQCANSYIYIFPQAPQFSVLASIMGSFSMFTRMAMGLKKVGSFKKSKVVQQQDAQVSQVLLPSPNTNNNPSGKLTAVPFLF